MRISLERAYLFQGPGAPITDQVAALVAEFGNTFARTAGALEDLEVRLDGADPEILGARARELRSSASVQLAEARRAEPLYRQALNGDRKGGSS